MPRKPTVKTLKKKADALFSQYIRLTYSDEYGYVACYTCGVKGYWKKDGIQCGHGISGRGNYVRYLEEICRPQCYSCNCGKGGNYEVFIPKLINEIGFDEYNRHVTESRKPHKRTLSDYQDIIAYYDMRVTELLQGLENNRLPEL